MVGKLENGDMIQVKNKRLSMRMNLTLIFILTITSFQALSQDSLKLMQYNLMYYGKQTDYCTSSNNDIDTKNTEISKVINYYKPDIFAVNELDGQSAAPVADDATYLLNNALNTGGINYYKKVPFEEPIYLVNTLFYNHNKLGLMSYHPIRMHVGYFDKIFNAYRFYYKSEDLATTSDTLFFTCFVAHLKAGSGSAQERSEEAEVLMDYIQNTPGVKGNYFILGDLNVYHAEEPAFQKFINPADADFRFNDPVNQLGDWHENESFSAYHTQSTHRFGSCHSGGGMDDRFDFILASDYVMDGTQGMQMIPGSYRALGQDGNNFNAALNTSSNENVPNCVASALYEISDHLPVTMAVSVDKSPGVQIDFDTVFYEPKQPTSKDSVRIFAQITDPEDRVDSLKVYWGKNSQLYTSSKWMPLSGNSFSSVISAQEAGEEVFFQIHAVNSNGTLLKTSQEQSYTVAEATQLKLFSPNHVRIRISNPVYDQLQITVHGKIPQLKLTIGTMGGSILITKTYGVVENQRLMLPVGSLAPGMYWVKMETGIEPAHSRKFIKLKH